MTVMPLVRLGEVATITQGLVTSGRGAGAREGDWEVKVASVGDIKDDRLDLDGLDTAKIERNARTERHLLRPHDVLVTGRSTAFKAALVPPAALRTVADATLLVVRAQEGTCSGPFLWWFLTSSLGRQQAQGKMVGATVPLLSANALAEIEIPLPPLNQIYLIDDLVDASERAYVAAAETARLRRTVFRDGIIEQLSRAAEKKRG